MVSYFVRRFLLIIPTFLACTLVVFMIVQLTPGGPFDLAMMQAQQQQQSVGEGGGGSSDGPQTQVPPEAKDALMKYFELDKPLPIRYVSWLGRVVTGDFGDSYKFGEPVLTVIVRRFPVSIYFGLIGFTLAYIVCVPLGVYKAIRHSSFFDIASSILVFIGYSIPGFALGALLLVLLGRNMGWFPIGGFRSEGWEYLSTWDQIVDQVHHTVLPVIAYMISGFATLTILMKNSLMENLGQDYVRTAFAKGLSERRVIFVHALRNSMIPIATGLGHALSLVLAGALLIEKTFGIEGMGLLSWDVLLARDYTVFMGIVVFSVVLQLLGNIISDMLYASIDPRIRFR